MGVVVISAYRPRPGMADGLLEEMRTHLPILREQGLVTDRESIVMRAKDGTIIEVFEWESPQAIQAAHDNEAVKEMWSRYEKVCEYATLKDLEECQGMFASFEPVNVT